MSVSCELFNVARKFAQQKQYKVIKFAGKGAFKETYCIQDDKREQFALKLVPQNKYDPARSQRELNAMLKCDIHYIGKLIDFGKFN